MEPWVGSLGREDPLGKGMAPHSNILAWRIPWTETVIPITVHGVAESDMTEWLTLTQAAIIAGNLYCACRHDDFHIKSYLFCCISTVTCRHHLSMVAFVHLQPFNCSCQSETIGLFYFFFNICLVIYFGCIGSELQHSGSFVGAQRTLVSWPGMEPVSPALGEVLTTWPPGKSL